MNFKSQRGYSVLEIGVGLIIITIFLVCSITMLSGTYSTYRLVEQKNIAISYAINGIERELLEENISITDNSEDTTILKDGPDILEKVTKIPINNMTLTTKVESLPDKNGINYSESKVKLVTSTVEFYTKKDDETSKRTIELKTLKIGGNENEEK